MEDSKKALRQSEIPGLVKEAVGKFDPTARIFLYGSRARGEDEEFSDWDFLILMGEKPNPAEERKIRRSLYEIEWDRLEIICPVIRSRDDWNSPRRMATPFYSNVMKDAVEI